MKKLYIMRHAKSDWNDESLDDYDRPLNKRGEKDAPFMAKLLKQKDAKLDLIISSPAKRAIQTANILAKQLNYTKAIQQNQYIYEAYVNTLQEIVSYIHDDHDIVALVGHNPGVSALAYMLSSSKESFATSAFIEITFEADSWMSVNKEHSKVLSYEFPKKHEQNN